MSTESTQGSRFVTILEAYAAVYDASDSILKDNECHGRDPEEHPIIAENIGKLLDALSELTPKPDERLSSLPLVNVDSFLSGIQERIRSLDGELTAQNGGFPLPFMQLPAEIGALCTVSVQVEARLNSVDRNLN